MSSALVLVAVEWVLRRNGHRPWRFATMDVNEPTIYEPDPVLGWRPKPGHYLVPPYSRGADSIDVTILPDGARATGLERDGEGMKLFFVGMSFTQGWAVSDHETYARKLQEQFPELSIRNYGIGAYSTFQSLLFLQRLLDERPAPDWIFHELDEDLERRNVATPNWLRGIASYSKRGVASVPYCTLDENGELVRHSLETYPQWPFREHLATVATAERIYADRRGTRRSSQRREVTKKLLLEMRDFVESKGIRFTISLLNFSEARVKAEYADFLRANGVEFVDCAFPLTADMQVQGEGHANGKMHARWASCIAPVIEKGLSKGDSPKLPRESKSD